MIIYMCYRIDCVCCETVTLEYGKLYIHYNSLFIPILIEFVDDFENTHCYYKSHKSVFIQTPVNLEEIEEIESL